ncbi:MAG: histidine kinase [Taibaiella sp.]|nr:histidine kinase [Taibaiella sp.]
MTRSITISFLLCCLSLSLPAQQSSYNFRKLGISDGLHDGAVKCIGQDAFGFIWIATVGALNRYDSRKVEVFTFDMNDSTTPYSSQPKCMLSDKQGRFWIGYETGLLEYKFATGTFRKVPALEKCYIHAIACTNDSTLYLGSPKGLIKLNTRTEDTVFYARSSNPKHAPLAGAKVYDITYKAPYLYLGTNKSLMVYDINRDSAFALDVPELKGTVVAAIDVDSHNDIWMGSFNNAQLSRLHSDWKTLDVYDKWLSADEKIDQLALKEVLVDRNDNVWFLSAVEGIIQYVRAKDTVIKHLRNPSLPSGLNTNSFKRLFLDRSGMMWAGSDVGVSYFKPEKSFFSVLMPYDNNLWERERTVARAVTIDNRGVIWMGTHEGVSNYDPNTGKYREWRNEPGRPPVLWSKWIRSICYAGRWVWIGTSAGVNRYDLETNKMEFVAQRDLPLSFYNTITADRSGNVWFGTNDSNSLYWYSLKEGKYHSLLDNPSLSKYQRYTPVSYVYEDRKQRIWISFSRKGIIRYDKLTGETVLYDTKQDAPHRIIGDQVIDIKEDSEGVIWVSSMNGVSGIDVEHGTIQNINRKNGLVNNWVSPIIVDANDRVWMGASGGLTVMEKDRATMTTFTLADGLPSVGFPEHAGIMDSNGVVWMATYNGYISFNTNEYRPDTSRVPFYATAYHSTNGISKRLFIGDKQPTITLPAGDNAFTLEMSALNYANPTQTKFAYRLSGFEDEWHYSQDGKATYTNIPGGSYHFEYKAASGNTPWDSVKPKVISMEIGSFFYQKKWFWVLLSLLIFSSLWAYYRKQLRNQKKIYDLQSQADALQRENALVQFESLKQQLNPHFLFNSLTSLSGLIHADTRQASRFLERLGKLYRYILNSQENETVTLGEEIQFSETYLHLQKTRFGDGLILANEVDKSYYQKRIAPVTLQKLIENAIKHNVIDPESPLRIRVYVEDGYLVTENNLQRKNFVETSNKKGLSSLVRLYGYISDRPVIIGDDSNSFIVKIPLL